MHIAICDDEEKMRQELLTLLKMACAEQKLTTEPVLYTSAEELLVAIEQGAYYDLIFLDIEMGAVSGMEAAERIRMQEHQTELIFVTSHQDYMPTSFVVEPFDYLIKPVQCNTFQKTFRRFLTKYQRLHHEFPIQTTEGLIALAVADIVYLSSRGKMLDIYICSGKVYVTRQKISDAERALQPWQFCRIHQGYLVNLAYMQEISRKKIGSKIISDKEMISKPLTNGQSLHLPISRNSQNAVEEDFMRYQMKGRRGYLK